MSPINVYTLQGNNIANKHGCYNLDGFLVIHPNTLAKNPLVFFQF